MLFLYRGKLHWGESLFFYGGLMENKEYVAGSYALMISKQLKNEEQMKRLAQRKLKNKKRQKK